MTTTTAVTTTGGDWDCPAQGKLDLCNDGVSDCYQSGMVAELGMAVAMAVVVKAEAVGAATEKNGGGGNTKTEENLCQ
jgi:hypothetical protein